MNLIQNITGVFPTNPSNARCLQIGHDGINFVYNICRFHLASILAHLFSPCLGFSVTIIHGIYFTPKFCSYTAH